MDGKIEEEKSNYARETRDKQWRRYGTEKRGTLLFSLYDSEIINYCFVCRHIAFVTVKERLASYPDLVLT